MRRDIFIVVVALVALVGRCRASNTLPLPTWELLPATPDDSTPWGIVMGAGAQTFNHFVTKTIQMTMFPFIMVVEFLEVIFNGNYATFGDKIDNVFKLVTDRIAFFALLHLRFIRGFLVIMSETLLKLFNLFFPGLAQETFMRWKGYSQQLGGSGASPNVTNPLYHTLNYGYPPMLE